VLVSENPSRVVGSRQDAEWSVPPTADWLLPTINQMAICVDVS